MRIIADLHIHSRYARATSEHCDLDGFAEAARLKGISLLGTSDFTHPHWFDFLKTKLMDSGEGVFSYKGIYFVLSTEVSVVFELNRKIKKMHHVILSPSLEVAAQINNRLSRYGNLAADGRPTLSISSAGLVEELIQISNDIMVIPAHVWTPWFSIFGSNSGVDSVEEAFEDQAKHIYALETGLSADPMMCWMLSALDKYTLLSNSDSHSLENIGREANIFELERLSYSNLIDAIKTRKGFVKTYEFYPEGGKYHYDGHRNCNVLLSPTEAERYHNICPVCKRKLTIGVLHRVQQLADRKYGFKPEKAVHFQYLVPLRTIVAKVLRKTEHSKAVLEECEKLVRYFGNEFAVYEASEEQIRLATNPEIANALIMVNTGKVKWIPGYDGVFGELILDDKQSPNAVDKKQKTLWEF